jgi:hypothetical protein
LAIIYTAIGVVDRNIIEGMIIAIYSTDGNVTNYNLEHIRKGSAMRIITREVYNASPIEPDFSRTDSRTRYLIPPLKEVPGID